MVVLFDVFLFALVVLLVLGLISKLVPKQKETAIRDCIVHVGVQETFEKQSQVLFCDYCGGKLKVIYKPKNTKFDTKDGKVIYTEYNVTCPCQKWLKSLVYDKGKWEIK